MSSWHREYPELAGTDADPAMRSEGYRMALGVERPEWQPAVPDGAEDALREMADA